MFFILQHCRLTHLIHLIILQHCRLTHLIYDFKMILNEKINNSNEIWKLNIFCFL